MIPQPVVSSGLHAACGHGLTPRKNPVHCGPSVAPPYSATWPKPRPISEAPHKQLLLLRVPGFTPEWTMGLFDCCWVDMCCAEAEIEPTHFLPLPPEVR